MTNDVAYVTQEMWDRAQAALRAALPVIEQHTPPLSTAGTMVSLRDQVRAAIAGGTAEPSADPLDAWSDIHSAPKDGNRILALVPERQFYANTDTPNELIPVVVRWVGEFQGWTMPGISGLRPVLWQSIRLTETGAEHG